MAPLHAPRREERHFVVLLNGCSGRARRRARKHSAQSGPCVSRRSPTRSLLLLRRLLLVVHARRVAEDGARLVVLLVPELRLEDVRLELAELAHRVVVRPAVARVLPKSNSSRWPSRLSDSEHEPSVSARGTGRASAAAAGAAAAGAAAASGAAASAAGDASDEEDGIRARPRRVRRLGGPSAAAETSTTATAPRPRLPLRPAAGSTGAAASGRRRRRRLRRRRGGVGAAAAEEEALALGQRLPAEAEAGARALECEHRLVAVLLTHGGLRRPRKERLEVVEPRGPAHARSAEQRARRSPVLFLLQEFHPLRALEAAVHRAVGEVVGGLLGGGELGGGERRTHIADRARRRGRRARRRRLERVGSADCAADSRGFFGRYGARSGAARRPRPSRRRRSARAPSSAAKSDASSASGLPARRPLARAGFSGAAGFFFRGFGAVTRFFGFTSGSMPSAARCWAFSAMLRSRSSSYSDLSIVRFGGAAVRNSAAASLHRRTASRRSARAGSQLLSARAPRKYPASCALEIHPPPMSYVQLDEAPPPASPPKRSSSPASSRSRSASTSRCSTRCTGRPSRRRARRSRSCRQARATSTSSRGSRSAEASRKKSASNKLEDHAQEASDEDQVLLKRLLLATFETTSGSLMDQTDQSGAYPIHALMVGNTDASLALSLDLFRASPALLTRTHGKGPSRASRRSSLRSSTAARTSCSRCSSSPRSCPKIGATTSCARAASGSLLQRPADAALRRDAARLRVRLRIEAGGARDAPPRPRPQRRAVHGASCRSTRSSRTRSSR